MKVVAAKQPSKPRAEAARERRASTSQTRTQRASRNVTVPRHTPYSPPVTVRGGVLGTPLHQKARGNLRRQFYYALGTTGAEVRLPAVPMVNPGWRLLSAAIVIALIFGLYTAYNSPTFQVEKIKITGLQRIKPAEVEKLLDLRRVPVFQVDPAALQTQLEKTYPDLASVSIKVDLPAAVTVTAVERKPVLAWEYKDETYWVDQDGYIFKPRGKAPKMVTIQSNEKPPLIVTAIPLPSDPAVTAGASVPTTGGDALSAAEAGDLVTQQMDPVILKAAQVLAKAIPAGTALAYTSKNGMGWTDPAGWNVYIGLDLDNIAMKMKVYKAVVAKLNSDDLKPVMISVENLNAPFYRLEQ